MDTIYITSSDSSAGKTAMAASLAQLLQATGKKVGYYKPVVLAQNSGPGLNDADPRFCARALGAGDALPSIVLSQEDLLKLQAGVGEAAASIQRTLAHRSQSLDVLLIEGLPCSGETGEASAALANILGARMLMVARYRPGLSAASITANVEAFRERFIGVIINAIPALALRSAREELGPALRREGLPVLGFIPEDRLLLSFAVADYARGLNGVILNNPENSSALVENLLVGANVLDSSDLYYSRRENKALLTRFDRPDLQWSALEGSTRCVILTGGGEPIPYVQDKATEAGIPLITTQLTTMEAVAKIAGFPATTVHHADKLQRFAQLLREHADLTMVGLQSHAAAA